jgi:hypothetical protein
MYVIYISSFVMHIAQENLSIVTLITYDIRERWDIYTMIRSSLDTLTYI